MILGWITVEVAERAENTDAESRGWKVDTELSSIFRWCAVSSERGGMTTSTSGLSGLTEFFSSAGTSVLFNSSSLARRSEILCSSAKNT